MGVYCRECSSQLPPQSETVVGRLRAAAEVYGDAKTCTSRLKSSPQLVVGVLVRSCRKSDKELFEIIESLCNDLWDRAAHASNAVQLV